MIIKELQIKEIKGVSNTLLSLAEETATEEYIRDILYYTGSSIQRLVAEIEVLNGKQKKNYTTKDLL